jgi:16S rRNA (guanine527-N7)-methyltransferase
LTREEFEQAAGVSRETSARFESWMKLLADWSAHTNLVGRATLEDFWERHALDSFQLFPLLPDGTKRIVDIGAGAGFPGLALAAGFKDRGEEVEIILVESIAKKAKFLSEAAEAMGVSVAVKPIRVEHLALDGPVDVVTARAVAPLNKLLGLAAPLLKTGAIGLFPKGRRYQDELTEARKNWTFEAEVIPSRTSDGAILKLREVQRV